MNRKNLASLCDLVASALKKEPGSKQKLAKDSVQLEIIHEALNQLNSQKKYLHAHNLIEKAPDLIKNIENMADLLEKLLDKKSSQLLEDDVGDLRLFYFKPKEFSA